LQVPQGVKKEPDHLQSKWSGAFPRDASVKDFLQSDCAQSLTEVPQQIIAEAKEPIDLFDWPEPT